MSGRAKLLAVSDFPHLGPREHTTHGARTYVPWATTQSVRRTMQGNRSADTKPEVRLRSALHRNGLRFFKNRRPSRSVQCRVDILFPGARLAVFVDGCFWHGCPLHGRQPKTNSGWWEEKLSRNRQRDLRNDHDLETAGWRVLRLWEHEPVEHAVELVRDALLGPSSHLRTTRQASPTPGGASPA